MPRSDILEDSYNNAVSGLSATTVKDAIDELDGRLDGLESSDTQRFFDYLPTVEANASVTSAGSLAIGGDAICAGGSSLAIGKDAEVGTGGNFSIALGEDALIHPSCTGSIALGSNCEVGDGITPVGSSIAIGSNCDTLANEAWASGVACVASGLRSWVHGYFDEASGFEAFAFQGNASGSRSIAFQANSTAEQAIAFQGNASGIRSIAFQGSCSANEAIQMGLGTNSTPNTLQFRSVRLANDQGLYTSFTNPTNYTPADTDNVTSHLEAIDGFLDNIKTKLTANTTFYIDPTNGADVSGAGLTTGAGAYATLPFALDDVADLYDLDDYKAIFQLADGTYTLTGSLFLPSFFTQTAELINGPQVVIQGNSGDNTAVTITRSGTPSRIIDTNEINISVGLKDLTLTHTNSNTDLVWIVDSDFYEENVRVEGTFRRAFVLLKNSNAQQVVGSTFGIGTSNAQSIFSIEESSRFDFRQSIEIESGATVTLSDSFIYSASGSRVLSGGTITNNGTVTGNRFKLVNAGIERDDDDLNYYPGNSAGTFEGICFYGSFNTADYDNTTSGLAATTVPAAIDEIYDDSKYFTTNSTGTAPSALGTDSIAIGRDAFNEANNGIVIGFGATNDNAFQNIQNTIIIGTSATISPDGTATTNCSNSIAIGSQAEVVQGFNAVALGFNTEVGNNGAIAIGANAIASEVRSLAIGGGGPTATEVDAVQIGPGTNTTGGTIQYQSVSIANDRVVTPFQIATEVTATTTAVNGEVLPVNVSSGAVTINPPASPQALDTFAVTDSRSNAATNNITVDFTTATQNFHGASANHVISIDKGYAEFMYLNSTVGWILK